MLAYRKTLAVAIMAFLIAIMGCQTEEEPIEQTTQPEVAPQSETTVRDQEPTDPKADFQETVQNQLTELERDIEALKDRAANVPEESKEEFNQMMQSLQSQKEVVEERLEALKGESLEEWETLKSSTEEALNDLKNRYQNVANRFSS